MVLLVLQHQVQQQALGQVTICIAMMAYGILSTHSWSWHSCRHAGGVIGADACCLMASHMSGLPTMQARAATMDCIYASLALWHADICRHGEANFLMYNMDMSLSVDCCVRYVHQQHAHRHGVSDIRFKLACTMPCRAMHGGKTCISIRVACDHDRASSLVGPTQDKLRAKIMVSGKSPPSSLVYFRWL